MNSNEEHGLLHDQDHTPYSVCPDDLCRLAQGREWTTATGALPCQALNLRQQLFPYKVAFSAEHSSAWASGRAHQVDVWHVVLQCCVVSICATASGLGKVYASDTTLAYAF